MQCPLAGPCHGAHDCSLSAALYAVPQTPQLALTEVVRRERGRWGYWEYGAQRDVVRASSLSKTNLFNLSRPGVKIAYFHILVGEGVNRATLEKGVRAAVQSQDEIWIQEHNVAGDSWRKPRNWPVGHGENPPREANSQMFSLEELTAKLHLWASDCTEFKSLQSCLIRTPQDPAGRNMQVGIRCRCRGCQSLFCRPWGSSELYQGSKFVYTAHADPPFDEHTIQRANRPFDVYMSVVGGMTGLEAMALPNFSADVIVFYDVNPFAIEFGKLVIQIVKQSKMRLEFLSHMLRRDLYKTGVFPPPEDPPTGRMRRVAEQLARTADVFTGELNLTVGERCAYDWLLREESHVCQKRDLYRDATKPPSIDPHRILRPHFTPWKTNNTCSFYYGHGWLTSEATFQRVQRALRAQVFFREFNLNLPLDTLFSKKNALPHDTVLFFTSNIVAPPTIGPLHARLAEDGRRITHIYRGDRPSRLYISRDF